MLSKPQLLFSFLLLLINCTTDNTSATSIKQLIQEQITAHYDSLELEGYQPLAFSAINTIAVQCNQTGDISVIIGEVTHRYRIKQGDSLEEQSHVFNVQVYEDEVIAFPAKKDPEKNNRPLINI